MKTSGALSLFIMLLMICTSFFCVPGVAAADFDEAISGMERRYAAAETAAGSFKQIYRAPGILQEETGVFQLKRPGLMRWESRTPEEKLFIADGKECFIYAPLDHQVTIHPLTPADLARTPFAFLLGGGNIRRDYTAAAETEFKPAFSDTVLLRLAPVRDDGGYIFVTLELDAGTFDIRRVILREQSGSTSEFLISSVVLNQKTNARDFQFKPPKGVEIVRINE